MYIMLYILHCKEEWIGIVSIFVSAFALIVKVPCIMKYTNKPEISGSGQIVNISFGFDQETKEIYLEFDSE